MSDLFKAMVAGLTFTHKALTHPNARQGDIIDLTALSDRGRPRKEKEKHEIAQTDNPKSQRN